MTYQGSEDQKNPCESQSPSESPLTPVIYLSDDENHPDHSEDLNDIQKIENISAPKDADWEKDWISATSTRNYILRDPLIDWLKINYSPFVTKNPKYTKNVLRAVTDRRNPNSFIEYIMEQGNIFETHVIRLLTKKFGKDIVVSLGGELNARSSEKVQETLNAMLVGIPIIHGGLLHNPKTRTYGIPDLLVRSDWINELSSLKSLSKEEVSTPAPRLRDIHDPEKVPSYHYIVVDIKFTTLNLRADGIHILNCNSFPAYKSQLYIYNEALALIQGYNPKKAYILGRKWKFTSKGETYKGKSCFDKLGKIDYHGLDKQYITKTESALVWLREVRSPESRDWNIIDPPLHRPELYPNMSNTCDYPWHNVKSQLADHTKELTSLWMVGTENRKVAHAKGVYKWTDEKCSPDTLGVNGKFTSRILEKILEVNSHNVYVKDKVLPLQIQNNLKDWQTPDEIEFYVDFETINDVLTDFDALPNVENTSLIFMIGVGYSEPISGRWNYKCFCVDHLTKDEEHRICSEFSEYILSESAIYEIEKPMCVHWAHAEHTFWEDAVERHGSASDGWNSDEWEWLDLLKIFKEEPIVIRGALGFGLKQVSAALKDIKCISSEWDSGSSCLDGRGAMVGAWRAHKEANLRKINMRDIPQIREIMKYNEIDVRVLHEIITYLRENHTQKDNRKRSRQEIIDNPTIYTQPPQKRRRLRRVSESS